MKYQSFTFFSDMHGLNSTEYIKAQLSSTVKTMNEACNQVGACTPIVTYTFRKVGWLFWTSDISI